MGSPEKCPTCGRKSVWTDVGDLCPDPWHATPTPPAPCPHPSHLAGPAPSPGCHDAPADPTPRYTPDGRAWNVADGHALASGPCTSSNVHPPAPAERCPFHSRAWGVRCDRDMGHPGLCLSAGDAFAPGYIPPAPADVATDGPNSPGAVYDACRRATAPADDAECVCGEPGTKGVIHRADAPCFHRPSPRPDADPLAPEDHARCAAEKHPADDAPRESATASVEAMREALQGWARFCMKWPAKECDDGSGYYSEADHDQAACYAETLRVLALPLPGATPDATRVPARDDAVEEARSKVVEAAVAWCAPNADDGMTDMLLDAVNKYAALRREKESRSDDSRPASGQGGDK